MNLSNFKSMIKQSIFKDDEMINEFIFKDCKEPIIEKVYNFYKGRAKVTYKKGFIKRPRLQIELSFDNRQVFKRVESLKKKNANIQRTFEEEVIKGISDLFPVNTYLEFTGYATSSSDPIKAKIEFINYNAEARIKENFLNKISGSNTIDPNGKIIINVTFQTNYIQPVETKRDLKFEEKVIWAVYEAKDSYERILYNLFRPKQNTDGEKCFLNEISNNQFETNLHFLTSDSIIMNKLINIKYDEYIQRGLQIPDDIIFDIFSSTADSEIKDHNFNYFYNIVGNEIKGNFNLKAKTYIKDFKAELVKSENSEDIAYDINCNYIITIEE